MTCFKSCSKFIHLSNFLKPLSSENAETCISLFLNRNKSAQLNTKEYEKNNRASYT